VCYIGRVILKQYEYRTYSHNARTRGFTGGREFFKWYGGVCIYSLLYTRVDGLFCISMVRYRYGSRREARGKTVEVLIASRMEGQVR